jgi:hypothetical protein
MADRYWVGGTGTWDATTTNWSATNGGAGGASVPTASDDVFFTSLSNATAYVCTLTTAPVCRSVSVVGPATGNVTIAGSAAWSIFGSLTIAASGVTWTNTSNITFAATTTGFTITTNGVSLTNAATLNGAGGGWTLGSAYTTSSAFTVAQGSFATANFNLTAPGGFNAQGALTRSLTLGSSAISCGTWNCLSATNLTINAGTSTITLTSATGTFNGGGLTYYNVFKANNGFIIGDAGNTFNALTNNTITSSGTYSCQFAGNQTIGTLTVNGGSNERTRASIQTTPGLAGTQITLTVGSFVTNGYIDFRDINFQGAASPLTVATGGDAGNNANITLATPKTVYWNLAAGGAIAASVAWATASGGVPAVANQPLPQDTAIIEDTGLNSGATISFSALTTLGTLNMSTRTLPVTFTMGTSTATIYGDLTLSSAATFTSTTGVFVFSGYNKTQTITSAGTTVEANFTVNGLSTTVLPSGALTLGTTKTFTLTLGTLNLANNTLSCGGFVTSNSNIRTITFGTGQINLTGNAGTIWNSDVGTNLTYTGSPNIYCTYSGSTGTRSIQGSTNATATETNVFNFFVTAGTDTFSVLGARRYQTLDFTGFSGTLGTWVTSLATYGNFVASSTMTLSANDVALSFVSTLAQQNITSNGKTFDFPVAVNGTNTVQLEDNLTLGSTRALTLTTGTLNLNAKTVTSDTFSSTGAGVRSINFNGGTMAVFGATFTASGSSFTTNGLGTISMTSASSKTFAGGGFSYATLNQGGLGTLIITGANTFKNITNSVQPCTITFPASTTTTVNDFQVSGTAGNLVTLNSSTSGTKFTLNYVT